MLLSGLFNRGAMGVLERVMSFTQARHEVLVDNVSNFDTVGYKMRDLPSDEFFGALREAAAQKERRGTGDVLRPRSTRHYSWDAQGNLETTPSYVEDNNILFHDGNNRFVEKQMSDMAKNTMLHNVAVEMLRQQYNLLETAIRGRP
ncbi:MAG: hypothetical protein JW936_05320 [Sedimentisphaerales bacterium]|nr:hypothetical protein [Sedimentisphaerales bacterium]